MEFICGADLSCSLDQDTNQSNLVSRGTIRVPPGTLSGKKKTDGKFWFYQHRLISQWRHSRKEVRRSVPSLRWTLAMDGESSGMPRRLYMLRLTQRQQRCHPSTDNRRKGVELQDVDLQRHVFHSNLQRCLPRRGQDGIPSLHHQSECTLNHWNWTRQNRLPYSFIQRQTDSEIGGGVKSVWYRSCVQISIIYHSLFTNVSGTFVNRLTTSNEHIVEFSFRCVWRTIWHTCWLQEGIHNYMFWDTAQCWLQ